MIGDWFKLYRKIYDADSIVWRGPAYYLKVWIYLLGKVFYVDGDKFKRGQNFFRINDIAIACGIERHHVKRVIKVYQQHSMICTSKCPRGILVTIVNYELYQPDVGNGSPASVQKVAGKCPKSGLSIREEVRIKNKEEDGGDVIVKPKSQTSTSSISLNTTNWLWEGIPEGMKIAWSKKFPSVDIDRELEMCSDYLVDDERVASGRLNYYRYLLGWMRRQEERGGTPGFTPSQPKLKIIPKVGGGFGEWREKNGND